MIAAHADRGRLKEIASDRDRLKVINADRGRDSFLSPVTTERDGRVAMLARMKSKKKPVPIT